MDVELTAEDLKELVGSFKAIYKENEGRSVPAGSQAIS